MYKSIFKKICFVYFIFLFFDCGFASDYYEKAMHIFIDKDQNKSQDVERLLEKAIDEGDERAYVLKGIIFESKKSYKDMLLFYNTAADAGSILAMYRLLTYYNFTDTSQALTEIPRLKRTFLKSEPSHYNLKWYVDSLVLFLINKKFAPWTADEYCAVVLKYLNFDRFEPEYTDLFCGIAVEAYCVPMDDPRFERYLKRSYNAGIPSSVYYMGDFKLKELCDKEIPLNDFIRGLIDLRDRYFVRAGNLGYDKGWTICNKINETIKELEEFRNRDSLVGLLKSITDIAEENKGIIFGAIAAYAGAKIIKKVVEHDPNKYNSISPQKRSIENESKEYTVHYDIYAPRTKSGNTPGIIFYKNGDRSAFWSSNAEIMNLTDNKNTGSTTLSAGRWEVVLRYDSKKESIGWLLVGEGLPNKFVYKE
jgi:hypothetical protein